MEAVCLQRIGAVDPMLVQDPGVTWYANWWPRLRRRYVILWLVRVRERAVDFAGRKSGQLQVEL